MFSSGSVYGSNPTSPRPARRDSAGLLPRRARLDVDGQLDRVMGEPGQFIVGHQPPAGVIVRQGRRHQGRGDDRREEQHLVQGRAAGQLGQQRGKPAGLDRRPVVVRRLRLVSYG